MKIKYFLILCLFLISACTTRPNPSGWTEKTIATKYLCFQVWEKDIHPGEDLRIYIEGDGNPTPVRPIAMELAERDTHNNVVYISRACQYVSCDECQNPTLWQEERFNEEIINEMKSLIIHFSHKYKTSNLDLIGYDGGGTIAMLLATKVPVNRVITVGGILDTRAYAQNQNITLNGANPISFPDTLSRVAQVHYIGGRDTIFPRFMTEHFIATLKNPKSVVLKVVPEATHTDWQGLTVE